MEKRIKLNESKLRQIVSETISNILKEGDFANQWGSSYRDYKSKTHTNSNLDNIVIDLHTICQYYEPIYNAAYNNQIDNSIKSIAKNTNYLKTLTKLLGNIYSFMANRNNNQYSNQAMSIDEIKSYCVPSLIQLSKLNNIDIISNAAKRILSNIN